jgi:hypothetical protein
MSDDKVVRLVPTREPQPPRADRVLAALIILTNGVVRVGKTAVYAAILLLAAIGAVSLIGR